MSQRGRAALGGSLVALSGAAVAEGCAAALGTVGPTRAVSEMVRDQVPGPLALTLIHLVGHWDKPLLVAGTVAGLASVGALAGITSLRSRRLGYAVFGLLALVGLLAQVPLTSVVKLLPIAIGSITWIVGHRMLLGGSVPSVDATQEPTSRRTFLKRAAFIGVVGTAAGVGGWWKGSTRRKLESARGLLRLPVDAGVEPQGANLGLKGMAKWRTPNESFYRIDTALSPPYVAPNTWRLRVHGLVDREITLTYEDLINRGLQGRWITISCVSNEVGGPLVGNAYWSGVPVREILAEAGVQPGADAVKQTSVDGWTCGTPLQALLDEPDALLVVAMNGVPLPVEHGFPVRMVVPGLYGFVSATKWLVDLEVTKFEDFSAYWTERGWAEKATMKLTSRIDVPADGATVGIGPTRFGGVAWSPGVGIEAVEVQLDGGAWEQAILGNVEGIDTWVQWSIAATLDAGDHVVLVRARDKSGATQTAVVRDVVPDGATGWHKVEFTAS
ncbi:MAG: molybdopterin-dependent oxidoreductase [Marmoricola sp.]